MQLSGLRAGDLVSVPGAQARQRRVSDDGGPLVAVARSRGSVEVARARRSRLRQRPDRRRPRRRVRRRLPVRGRRTCRSAAPVPTVLFEHNVEYLIWKRLRDLETVAWRRALLEVEWRKLRAREAAACRACRSDDRGIGRRSRSARRHSRPTAQITWIPTGVDTNYFTTRPVRERPAHVVFSGSMDWHPNEDAVRYFISEILPLVRAEVPAVTFTVVGSNPSPSACARRRPPRGVEVTGTLDDIRPAIAEAALCVVPLRAGSGTRLKIFEALAMGKAVVSTTVGAEGLAIESGRHYVAADGARELCPRRDRSAQRSRPPPRIGAAGRHLVESRYSWAQVARPFESHCQSAVEDTCTHPDGCPPSSSSVTSRIGSIASAWRRGSRPRCAWSASSKSRGDRARLRRAARREIARGWRARVSRRRWRSARMRGCASPAPMRRGPTPSSPGFARATRSTWQRFRSWWSAIPTKRRARSFIAGLQPDLIVARCKFILKPEVFTLARAGTFALHPGICPEYRNAHGCFWALANRDLDRVGMTLLKIDRGVDTGPALLQATCRFDEVGESHYVIQQRVVFDNLERIWHTLMAAGRGDGTSADRYCRTRFCGLGPAQAHQLPPLEARRPSRSKTRGTCACCFMTSM